MGRDESRASGRKPRAIPRPRITPGPLYELKSLLYQLYVEAGAPSIDQIVALINADDELPGAPSRDTVHRILGEARVPPQQADVVAVVVVLARESGWDATHTSERIKTMWIAARLEPSAALLTAAKLGPVRLGVHPAIHVDTPAGAAPNASSMPRYINRPHDKILREQLKHAVDGQPVFAVLVGGSCSGKTRALYEAVLETLPEWQILIPSSAIELVKWIEAGSVDAGTIVWLNELQRFLPHAGRSLSILLGKGEPIVVVGALWPSYWYPLLRPVAPGQREADELAHTKQLLEAYHPQIMIPERFTPAERSQLIGVGDADRRLREAARAGSNDGRVIQHLTGGPDLVERFESPDDDFFTPIEKIIVTAALDARRLGHSSALTVDFLRSAVNSLAGESGISDDPDWIISALHSICHDKRVRGTLTALTEVRVAHGVGPADGYHPADYLDQHARRSRRFIIPSLGFWQAARCFARTPVDLVSLGESAEDRLRFRLALSFYDKAAESGSVSALENQIRLRERLGDITGASSLASYAALNGEPSALRYLGRLRERGSDLSVSKDLYLQAAELGDVNALVELARIHQEVGERREAGKFYRKAVREGHSVAMMRLAYMMEGYRSLHYAAELFRAAAASGEPRALRHLARVLERLGQPEEAEDVAQGAPDTIRADALADLAEERERSGHSDAAVRLALLAAQSGESRALRRLAVLRIQNGQEVEAEALAIQAKLSGDATVLKFLSLTMERAADEEEAERLARMAADTDCGALTALAQLRERRGNLDSALRLYRAAAAVGDTEAIANLARISEKSGDTLLAEQLIQKALELGDGTALKRVAQLRELAENRSGALALYQLAVEKGYDFGHTHLARLYEMSGNHGGADLAAIQAGKAGDRSALADLADMRSGGGDVVGARTTALLALDSGNSDVVFRVSEWTSDRTLRQIVLYGVELDGSPCRPWAP